MAQRRITELTEATKLKNDMCVPVDHGTDGTQKVSIGTLIDDTLATVESAIAFEDVMVNTDWRQGIPNENTGVVISSTTRICTQKFHIPSYAKELLMTIESGYKCAWYAYDSSGAFVDKYYWLSTTENIITIDDSWAYFIVGLANTSNSTITTSESGNITVGFSTKTADLKDLVDDTDEEVKNGYRTFDNIESGTRSGDGNGSASSTRIRTPNIRIKQGQKIYVDPGSNKYGFMLWYGSSTSYGTIVRNESPKYSDPETLDVISDGFLCILFGKTDNTQDISVSDYDGEIRIYDSSIAQNRIKAEAIAEGLIPVQKDKTTYGKYINGNVGSAFSYGSGVFSVVEAEVEGGKTYVLRTIGRISTTKYACFIDESNTVLKIENASASLNGATVEIKTVAPINAVRVALNVVDGSTMNYRLASYAKIYEVPDYLVEIESELNDSAEDYTDQYKNVQAAKRVFSTTDRTQNIASNSLPTFVHVADNHGDTATFLKAVKIADDVEADAILNTGDSVYYNSTDDYSYIVAAMNGTTIPMLPTIGNHDSYTLNEQGMYEKFIQPFETGLTLDSNVNYPTYYYKDFPALKIRVINVNQFQYRGVSNYSTQRHYTQEQIDFLCDSLLSTPNDYGIIVMMHTPESSIAKDGEYSKFYQNQVLYDNTGASITPVYDIIDAFISGTTLTKTWNNASGNTPASFSADVDFSAKNDAEFIAYLCGHMHRDAIGYASGTTNKQLVLNAVCTCAWSHKTASGGDGNSYPDFTELSDLPRTRNTLTETALNVYTIDMENGKVRVVRVGSDTPYDFSMKRDHMVIPYK